MALREPKEILVNCLDSEPRTFIIHKIPALDGRKVAALYLPSAAPKVGDYEANEEMALLMMKYIIAKNGDSEFQLTTRALIDNHIPDFECMVRLEREMIEYNTSFFREGKASGLFKNLEDRIRELASSTLTDLLERLSQVSKPPSES